MKTKIVFGLSHFFAGNTPQLIEKIGNFALILAFIATAIVGLPAELAAQGIEGFILPVFVAKLVKIMIAASITIKMICKCFGVIDPATGEKISTTTLQAPNAAPIAQ